MANDTEKVPAQIRDQFGKGAARKIRAAGNIPAVLYGHGSKPEHLTLPGHQIMLLLRRANALLTLDVEGKNRTALVVDVQRDPVRQNIEHLDLMIVKKGEKVDVEVPVHLEGEPFSGTIAMLEVGTIRLEAAATNIPERVVIDITDATEGTQYHAGTIALPDGSTLADDPELLLANIVVPKRAKADEEAEEAAVESEEAAGDDEASDSE